MIIRHPGFLYGVTVFVSSAMLLVLEIVAGRLLAPYVGVSLYTWTSIIGVILAGLSLGNWIGGRLADNGYGHKMVGGLLVVCAISSALVLPLLGKTAQLLQSMPLDLASASVIYVTILFLAPSVMIGMITPLVTTLYLNIDSRTGRVVGRMHALAALGSILGTFVAGFVLIQWLGTKNIVLVVAIILFLLSLPYLLKAPNRATATSTGAVLFLISVVTSVASVGYDNPCTVESNYYCLRVVDEQDENGDLYARTLVLDHMVHSTNIRKAPELLATPYIRIMDALIADHFADRKSLRYYFAGGGAYTHPRSVLARFPGAQVTVSEIDPAVTALAKSSLFLDTSGMGLLHKDSRVAMRSFPESVFDVVVTDVFHDVSIPYHLTTLEYAELVRNRLSPEGLYLANVIDVFPQQRLIQSMTRTLDQVFPHVSVWISPPAAGETRLTYVLAASNSPLAIEQLADQGEAGSRWYQVKDFIDQQIGRYDPPLLTDDFAPVERLLGPLVAGEPGI